MNDKHRSLCWLKSCRPRATNLAVPSRTRLQRHCLICLFPVHYIVLMVKISIYISWCCIPGFAFVRIGMDKVSVLVPAGKVAVFVPRLDDLNPNNSSKVSLTTWSHRDGTGNRTDNANASQVATTQSFQYSGVHSLHRSKLHAIRPTLVQGSPRLVTRTTEIPSSLLDSLLKAFSASSMLFTTASPNVSVLGLTHKSSTKADAKNNFFQAAGVGEGTACKHIGVFAERGCALGCTCSWYQYCDERAEGPSEFINVGICAVHWSMQLLFLSLICCSCTCVTFATALKERFAKESESSDEDFDKEDSAMQNSESYRQHFGDYLAGGQLGCKSEKKKWSARRKKFRKTIVDFGAGVKKSKHVKEDTGKPSSLHSDIS